MAPAVQTTYSERHAEAVAGMDGLMTERDDITRLCEPASMGFGLAVGRGTNRDVECVLGGALTIFLGATKRNVSLVHAAAEADKYIITEEVAIRRKGELWVQVTGAPGPNDPVHYNATTGVFAASGGTGPIRGARWVKTAANGLGLVYLSGDGQATS